MSRLTKGVEFWIKFRLIILSWFLLRCDHWLTILIILVSLSLSLSLSISLSLSVSLSLSLSLYSLFFSCRLWLTEILSEKKHSCQVWCKPCFEGDFCRVFEVKRKVYCTWPRVHSVGTCEALNDTYGACILLLDERGICYLLLVALISGGLPEGRPAGAKSSWNFKYCHSQVIFHSL